VRPHADKGVFAHGATETPLVVPLSITFQAFSASPIAIGPGSGRRDAQRLATSGLTADERDVPPRHAEALGKECDERIVRPAFDRQRGKPDLQAHLRTLAVGT